MNPELWISLMEKTQRHKEKHTDTFLSYLSSTGLGLVLQQSGYILKHSDYKASVLPTKTQVK